MSFILLKAPIICLFLEYTVLSRVALEKKPVEHKLKIVAVIVIVVIVVTAASVFILNASGNYLKLQKVGKLQL